LVFRLNIVVLPFEKAGIDLSEVIGKAQPQHLRVPHPAVILREIRTVRILILYAAPEYVIKTQTHGHLSSQEGLLCGYIHRIKGLDITLGSALVLHVRRTGLVGIRVYRQIGL
jgi:hypothetical protein